ncbi:MAG TPA: o-succinylbenzoate--CoA ligase [Candidatus Deferrimicrobium sp.]|nr:o-succinylbenzoate--CoA ligase [Candidatus Deferrimicrobium sp.]
MKINCPILQQAEQMSGSPAVIGARQTWTYFQLDRIVSRAVTFLEQKGIRRQTRVALVGRNSWEYIVLLSALWRMGAIAVPLNFRFPPGRIDEILKRQGIDHIIAGAADAMNFKESGTTIDWEECIHYLHYVQQDTPLSGHKQIDLNNQAAIILTSGSTGIEKGVLHTYGNYYYNALGSNENIKLAPGDRWILSLPLFHVGGLGILFRCFIAGATVVLPQETEKESLEDSFKIYRITHASLVSTQLLRLINQLEADGSYGSFSHLKALLLGGSGFPAALIHKALSLNLPIHTSYGLSEMASQVTTTPPGAPADKLFTSGKLLAHRELLIDENNEICVKGKTLFKGYVEGTVITRPWGNESRGGWFHTGDLGRIDADGYLTVLGRRDNMFISGGENIVPEEIEAILNELPEVEQVVVVPVANEMYGFRPAAFLKLRGNAMVTKDYLLNHLQEKLPRFKIPDFFYLWPEGFEQTSLKIKRSVFQELLQKEEKPTLL